jgi:hypothetical protein
MSYFRTRGYAKATEISRELLDFMARRELLPYTRLQIISDLIRTGLAVKLGKKQVDILLPPILELVRNELQGFSNRQNSLLAKIYKKAAWGELNTEDILRLAYKNDPDEFNRIIENNKDNASLSLGDKHKKHHA